MKMAKLVHALGCGISNRVEGRSEDCTAGMQRNVGDVPELQYSEDDEPLSVHWRMEPDVSDLSCNRHRRRVRLCQVTDGRSAFKQRGESVGNPSNIPCLLVHSLRQPFDFFEN